MSNYTLQTQRVGSNFLNKILLWKKMEISIHQSFLFVETFYWVRTWKKSLNVLKHAKQQAVQLRLHNQYQ